MVTAFSYRFETDLVTARTHARIMREINRDTGTYIVETILPRKFSRQAFLEYPEVVRPRSKKYAARKRRMVGHDIPNVLTGRLSKDMPATARITATQNGGRVYLRAYWAGEAKVKKNGKVARQGMRESQRQELEYVSKRDRDRMRARALRMYEKEANKPGNRRKRRVRGGG